MLKPLPIGIDDFEKLISGNYYFVDKSLFIKELLEIASEATLIPRPRRFGKTLNLSMLRYFFEKTENSRAHLFENLAVAQFKDIMAHQGQYPVIFFTLKSIRSNTWDECYDMLKEIIADFYRQHLY